MTALVTGEHVNDLLATTYPGIGLAYDRVSNTIIVAATRGLDRVRYSHIIARTDLANWLDVEDVTWTAFPAWIPETEASTPEGISEEVLQRWHFSLAPWTQCEGEVDLNRAEDVAGEINADWLVEHTNQGVVA